MFDAVDALIASASPIPPPAERERLRKAHGFTQEQVAKALKVRRATVVSWEKGKTEPRSPQREAYARLLSQLAELYPATATAPVPMSVKAPEQPPVSQAHAAPAHVPAAKEPRSDSTTAGPARTMTPRAETSASQSPDAKKTARSSSLVAADPRFAHGPLGVLDGDGSLYCVGGLVLDSPAETLPGLVEWVLAEAKLGAPRLHPSGKDFDPLIVLTATAAKRLGLPERLEDRRRLRLPDDHKVVQQITKAQWKLSRRGFGPWARIYRPAQGGRRHCVHFAVLPWGALDSRSWGATDHLDPAGIADVLGTYATRGITPAAPPPSRAWK
ncbi:helix-turn-helix domain-containing protein [Streptomyces sp. NBC_01727]|uniref:helix-turn-helix domain-containing protein n=1 Tax=Streptomyces sp. NBC_01727 TaxID=2975924 RepID=UPI002E0E098D